MRNGPGFLSDRFARECLSMRGSGYCFGKFEAAYVCIHLEWLGGIKAAAVYPDRRSDRMQLLRALLTLQPVRRIGADGNRQPPWTVPSGLHRYARI
jgi:hypothetical protein